MDVKEKKEKEEIKTLKIILLGENGVGKTSIINRYINNEFNPDNQNETLGSSFFTKEVKKLNTTYQLKIWDTTGQEKYHSITKLFINGANIVLVVYSLDLIESYNNLEYWISSVEESLAGKNYILVVVANKIDLKEEALITEEEGKIFAEDRNVLFKSISCKEEGDSVFKLFDFLLDEISKINIEPTDSYALRKKSFRKKKTSTTYMLKIKNIFLKP